MMKKCKMFHVKHSANIRNMEEYELSQEEMTITSIGDE